MICRVYANCLRQLFVVALRTFQTPVGDEEATAQAMKKLFDDSGLRARLGEAAAEVRERFSQEKVMRQWKDAIMGAMEH